MKYLIALFFISVLILATLDNNGAEARAVASVDDDGSVTSSETASQETESQGSDSADSDQSSDGASEQADTSEQDNGEQDNGEQDDEEQDRRKREVAVDDDSDTEEWIVTDNS